MQQIKKTRKSITYLFRYLNFLSLDAVCVALLWQEVFSRTGKIQLEWKDRTLLGLAVWAVYLLDHLLDSLNIENKDLPSSAATAASPTYNLQPTTAIRPHGRIVIPLRHHFIAVHRTFVIFAILASGLCAAILVLNLPLKMLVAGILLGTITLLYLLINGLLLARGLWPKGREIAVGVIFALGCGLVPLLRCQNPITLIVGILLFAILASINCTLIARMERNVPLEQLSLIPHKKGSVLNIIILRTDPFIRNCFLFLLLGTFLYNNISILGIATTASFLGLSLIPSIAKHFGYEIASFATDGTLILGALIGLGISELIIYY